MVVLDFVSERDLLELLKIHLWVNNDDWDLSELLKNLLWVNNDD